MSALLAIILGPALKYLAAIGGAIALLAGSWVAGRSSNQAASDAADAAKDRAAADDRAAKMRHDELVREASKWSKP
jgi:hypothetical protein